MPTTNSPPASDPAPVGAHPDNRAEYQTYTHAQLVEMAHLDDQRIAALEVIIRAMPPCPVHGALCLGHALEWVRLQQEPIPAKADFKTVPAVQPPLVIADLLARIVELEADRRYHAEVLDHLLERSIQQSGTNVDLRVRMNDLEHRIKPPVLSAALAEYSRLYGGGS